jgi:hypothetical protein
MIHLPFVSPMGQAGVKRLHPTRRRIRLHKQRSGLCTLLNKTDLTFDFTAIPFSKCRRLHIPGLKIQRMYNRGKLHLHLLAASQSGTCTFSVAQAFPQSFCSESPTPRAHFPKEKQADEASPRNRALQTRTKRNSLHFAVSLGTAPVTPALRKKLLTLASVFHEPCFSRVARQPQQPVVQALKKI